MKDPFEQSLEDKFFDILLNANRDVVQKELKNKIFEHCAMIEFFNKNGININEFIEFKIQNEQEIQDSVEDFYIGLMSQILSQNG